MELMDRINKIYELYQLEQAKTASTAEENTKKTMKLKTSQGQEIETEEHSLLEKFLLLNLEKCSSKEFAHIVAC